MFYVKKLVKAIYVVSLSSMMREFMFTGTGNQVAVVIVFELVTERVVQSLHLVPVRGLHFQHFSA